MYSATPPEKVTKSGLTVRASGSVSSSARPKLIERRAGDLVDGERREALGDRLAGRLVRQPLRRRGDAELAAPPAARNRRRASRRPAASCATSRPPTAKAATLTISPLSISASLVVPPPTSTCSTQAPRRRDSAVAPEPCAARMLSSLWPAVAQTNFPEFLGEDLVDGARVLALDRLAGQDHGAAVDVAPPQAGVVIGVLHEMLERLGVDGAVRQERRQHDRRAPDHLPVDHDEPARQILAPGA